MPEKWLGEMAIIDLEIQQSSYKNENQRLLLPIPSIHVDNLHKMISLDVDTLALLKDMDTEVPIHMGIVSH